MIIKPELEAIIAERQWLIEVIDKLIEKRDFLNTLIEAPKEDYSTTTYTVKFKKVIRKLPKRRKTEYLKSMIKNKSENKAA